MYPTKRIQIEHSYKYMEIIFLDFLRETRAVVSCLRTPPLEVRSRRSSVTLKNAKLSEISAKLEIFRCNSS